MKLQNNYIQVNKFTRPGLKLYNVKAILIHWTANPGASAWNHYLYFNNGAGGRYASAHIFIDKLMALCIIPENEVAYAANETGTSKIPSLRGNYGYYNGNANGCTISVELCVEKDGTISKEVEAHAAKIVADLCKKYKLTEKDVYRHYDVTGKSCPTPFIGNLRFASFKSKVKKHIAGKVVAAPKPKPITSKPVYFGAMPSTHLIQCKTNVGIYTSVDFKDATKLKEHYEPCDVVKVVGLTKSKGGTPRFKTSDGHYITANKAYVKKYTAPSKVTPIGTITTNKELNYYDAPRWNKPSGTVKKGTVLTIAAKVKADGYYQYKTISDTYITASDEHVTFKSK